MVYIARCTKSEMQDSTPGIKMASKVSSSSDDGGYKFVSEPSETLKCVICLKVARDPLQHEECGKLFCKECLDKYGRNKPCPNCKTGSQYYRDNRSEFELLTQ